MSLNVLSELSKFEHLLQHKENEFDLPFHGYVWRSILLFYYIRENVQYIQHIAHNSVSHYLMFLTSFSNVTN